MRKVLLVCWAVFLALVVYVFAVGRFFIGKRVPPSIWMPHPAVLLAFSLVLVLWTAGLLSMIAVRTYAGRLKR